MFSLVLLAASAVLGSASLNAPSEWYKPHGRIVGGVDATIGEFPYQLALERNNARWCGASLITPNVALTAAHCTDGQLPSILRVRGGVIDYGIGGEVADVVKICQHPKYTPWDYDVSVLLLSRSLPLSASIQTIALQPAGVEVPPGTLANVTGWGALASGGSSPETLQKVQLPKFPTTTCEECYVGLKITDRMDCYGYMQGGKASCQGDSGGPIVVDGKQVSIVSWARGCGGICSPSVFAKVSNKEITDHINSCIASF